MHLPHSWVALIGFGLSRTTLSSPTRDTVTSHNPGLIVEKTSRYHGLKDPELRRRASRFFSDETAPFEVDGTSLPDIPWDVGESYAGLLPITDGANETRKLFFWLFVSDHPTPKDEIVVWLNGGPGCSSMEGVLTENGPINWYPGTAVPTPNPYTWLNLTHMVWIDQPLGVGFSQGESDITDESELATQFAGFWKNFVKLFCMENWDMYLTGESYAGVYIPYIANAIIEANDPTYYNLKGIGLNAAYIGDSNLQVNMHLPSYTKHWNQILGLNETFMADLQSRAGACGLSKYLDDHLRFPPAQPLFRELLWRNDTWAEEQCDMLTAIINAWQLVNPCPNVYHITDVCPYPSNVLGQISLTGDPLPNQIPIWFAQPEVRDALHAPPNVTWTQCAPDGVFRDPDTGELVRGDPFSALPATTDLLGKVIDATGNVVIGSGGLDMLIPTNGTLLVLQNVTWGGSQGFTERPMKQFYSPYHPEYNVRAMSGGGIVGTWGSERGLTFYEVALGGHELPRYAPGPSFRALELLLGRIDSLSEVSDFTTQPGAGMNTNATENEVDASPPG